MSFLFSYPPYYLCTFIMCSAPRLKQNRIFSMLACRCRGIVSLTATRHRDQFAGASEGRGHILGANGRWVDDCVPGEGSGGRKRVSSPALVFISNSTESPLPSPPFPRPHQLPNYSQDLGVRNISSHNPRGTVLWIMGSVCDYYTSFHVNLYIIYSTTYLQYKLTPSVMINPRHLEGQTFF